MGLDHINPDEAGIEREKICVSITSIQPKPETGEATPHENVTKENMPLRSTNPAKARQTPTKSQMILKQITPITPLLKKLLIENPSTRRRNLSITRTISTITNRLRIDDFRLWLSWRRSLWFSLSSTNSRLAETTS
jgi:hypothetical protein